MDSTQLTELLERYHQGVCTDSEKEWVEKWYAKKIDPTNEMFFITENELQEDLDIVLRSLPHTRKVSVLVGLKRKYIAPAAAMVLLACAVLMTIYVSRHKVEIKTELSVKDDFKPGRNVAELQLSNGQSLLLDDVEVGDVHNTNGMQIRKTDEGVVLYAGLDRENQEIEWNTIRTPKGGQFKIILEDGTQVWLNAASSMRFPASFAKGERLVELSGEAYFDIAPNKSKPFRVKTSQQLLTVLGTQFNINSYEEEGHTITTLLTGSVRVEQEGKNTLLLKPGDQLRLGNNQQMKFLQVDTEQVVAWKNGLFKFEAVGIREAMRQYARWYDVEISYDGEVPDVELWGEAYRNEQASQALEMLEFFGVQYKIENNGNTRIIHITKKERK